MNNNNIPLADSVRAVVESGKCFVATVLKEMGNLITSISPASLYDSIGNDTQDPTIVTLGRGTGEGAPVLIAGACALCKEFAPDKACPLVKVE